MKNQDTTTFVGRKEINFSNWFGHPNAENPEHPVYWVNIALEALHEAKSRGLSQRDVEKIKASIREVTTPLLR